MARCQIIRYKFSYWGKGYNRGKINLMLDTKEGRTVLLENITPDHASFLMDLLRNEKEIFCDPDSSDNLISLAWEDVGWANQTETKPEEE